MWLLGLALCCIFAGTSSYKYKTEYFKQRVDHFGFSNNDVYDQRYLITQDSWTKGGPIFFYAGNEGSIESFANNTGIMWDWAPEFNAMVVFAEHRYYGVSMPYGNKSFENLKYLGYLSTEQALADFAVLIDHLKRTIPGAQNSAVVAFGGSYGGMLAAWLRMKYPHAVVGALASSAPVLQFTGITPCNVYFQIITDDYQQASPLCPKTIKRSWNAINNLVKNDSGLDFLTQTFRLCKPLTNNDTYNFINWVSNTWQNAAMTNYPYPTSFLMPIPGHPVKVMCQYLQDPTKPDRDLMVDIFNAVSIFQNYTGQASCFDITKMDNLDSHGWDFQTCTEMVMPMCSGQDDMFNYAPWNFTLFAQGCQKQFGVTPIVRQAEIVYGGRDLAAASNIIFSNGKLDPWSGGGVLKNMAPSVIAIVMSEAAHHLDLRSANPNDPLSVSIGRATERATIRCWINQKAASENMV